MCRSLGMRWPRWRNLTVYVVAVIGARRAPGAGATGRLMACVCLRLSSGLASALVWQSVRGTVTPWVVQVDRFGQAQAVAPAVSGYQPTDPQIAFHLARFIEDVRGLPADGIVLRQNWLRAYDFTTDRGAAALNHFARTTDPFIPLATLQIQVSCPSRLRPSSRSSRPSSSRRGSAPSPGT